MTLSSLRTDIDSQRPLVKQIKHHRAWLDLRCLGLILGLLVLGSGCEADQQTVSNQRTLAVAEAGVPSLNPEESRMWMIVGERRFAITLTNNAAARAFAAQLPLTLNMADLNSNEKHAELPKALPVSASRPGTIRQGDLMLYGSSTLVVFYLSFNTTYAYTRLGRIDDAEGLAQALGQQAVRISFSNK
jgi:hypothetical protein